jgi:hypothetical protein
MQENVEVRLKDSHMVWHSSFLKRFLLSLDEAPNHCGKPANDENLNNLFSR